jgi:16S rRNA (guanine1207-N2)-methyltransferase
MNDHYYANRPSVKHDERLVSVTIRGMAFSFWTDAGVFSKSGVDFGSRLLIETMDIPVDAFVLDVGCGYGPIGIAAAKLAQQGQVWMVDVNERAVSLAKRNIRQNGVTNAEAFVSDLYTEVRGETFDRILSNPPIRAGKRVVHQIFEEAASHLKEEGELWVVIQKKQGAPSAKKKLESLFEVVEDVARSAGYHIFRSRVPRGRL